MPDQIGIIDPVAGAGFGIKPFCCRSVVSSGVVRPSASLQPSFLDCKGSSLLPQEWCDHSHGKFRHRHCVSRCPRRGLNQVYQGEEWTWESLYFLEYCQRLIIKSKREHRLDTTTCLEKGWLVGCLFLGAKQKPILAPAEMGGGNIVELEEGRL